MNKPELLSPAGNIEALKAAIANGADAVYISGKDYGARKFAQNFSQEEIKIAINYAHLHGVKIYITANTIIYEEEKQKFIEYIKFLYLSGADAIIMQDIGMITTIRKILPDLQIHISTQANNLNDDTLELYKNLGITRVVLARELDIDQIKNLKINIEKEIFIHGALCISYSGCCLFSSLNGTRSGNRGQCAGPCRLPYTLIKNKTKIKTNGQYLLSPKELNQTKKIQEILNLNVQSLKIEGRMKSPEYVAFTTKMYRQLIDNLQTNQSEKDLKKLFNREFTEGHLFKNKKWQLMNIKTPNHIGIEIGKVTKINNKIYIELKEDLNQNDGIRFKETNKGLIINKLYNQKGLLIKNAKKGQIISIDNKINLKTHDTVLKTTDYELIEKIKKYKEPKIKVNFKIIAKQNQKLTITINKEDISITTKGNTIKPSITAPTTKQNIINQISKLGNTPFTVQNIDIDIDENIFIPLKELNTIRRKLTEKLIEKLTETNRIIPQFKQETYTKSKKQKIKINAYVTNETQLKYLIKKIDNIYTDNYKLYQKYKKLGVFYKTDRTNTNLPNYKNENLLITQLGDLNKYKNTNTCISDYTLNIVNKDSIKFLEKNNIKQITLSPELSINQIKTIAETGNIEVIIYGTLELMVMKHCIINMLDKCPNCKNNKYYLENKQKQKFQIITKNCQTHIMHHQKINLINQIKTLKKYGVTNFRLELLNEDIKQIENILKKINIEMN